MASNRRGKLKEHFAGIHTNLDWVIYHSQFCLNIIGDDNPKLSKAVKALGEAASDLDKCAQGIYATL